MSGRAVFIDRDDTIIRDRPYLNDPEGVELIEGAARAVRELNVRGVPAILVTNQSGIARGLLDESRLEQIHARLTRLLAEQGAALDAIYYCPHHPEGSVARYAFACPCRKPEPGLLLRAAEDFGLDLGACYMVGDKPLDIETIHRVGGKGVLIGPAREAVSTREPDYRARDLLEAVRWILEDMRS